MDAIRRGRRRPPASSTMLAMPSSFRLLSALCLAGLTQAHGPAPFALSNGGWAGIDGNWSTVEVSAGSEAQQLQVLVSTTLSEFWAVGSGGCYPKEQHCSQARGGIYHATDSTDWTPMGTWQLGLEYLGDQGNGDYGLDLLEAHSNIKNRDVSMKSALMASVNTTDFFLGQFGLGITQGNFGDVVAESPLTTAVKSSGIIPSYSYGYTAGAHYRNAPASLTLGGYDSSRLVEHGTEFTIDSSDALPHTLVRGIEVTAGEVDGAREAWKSDALALSQMNMSFSALIDSTTPYLWLPNSICDKFASALDLTYDNRFDLYTISDDLYKKYSSPDSHNFTFSLSSSDNSDNLGSPLNVPGVVNITIPARAFVSTLQYPFKDEAISYGSPAVPYFSLRRLDNSSTAIIGRSFLQEAYLRTQYDRGVFSIHQASFPEQPDEDAEIVAIEQPPDSPYPPPKPPKGHGLSKGAIAGIVVGASALALLISLSIWFFRRRPTRGASPTSDSFQDKRSTSSSSSEGPRGGSPVARMLERVLRRKRSGERGPSALGQPLEAPNTQIYELPGPSEPVELNGDNSHDDVVDEEANLGLSNGQTVTAYEQAQLKIDRQLAGPLPEYTLPTFCTVLPPEKAVYDFMQDGPDNSPVQTSTADPVSPAGLDSNNSNISNHLGGSDTGVSPISQRDDWMTRFEDNPSPVTTTAPTLPLPMATGDYATLDDDMEQEFSSISSSEEFNSPIYPPHTSFPTSSGVQRTPIDSSQIVCLGPLPENIQLPHQNAIPQVPQIPEIPQIVGPNGRTISPPSICSSDIYEETLGSNFTEEEEEEARAAAHFATQPHQQEEELWPTDMPDPQQVEHMLKHTTDSRPQTRRGRIDGTELIHVPQPAAKRYSWEDYR